MGEMAQKIVKLDLEQLQKVLNEAFAEEWLAYYQYWIAAKVAMGLQRSDIVREFNEHAKEELQHADWLAERIIQLGGTPILILMNGVKRLFANILHRINLMFYHYCMIIC